MFRKQNLQKEGIFGTKTLILALFVPFQALFGPFLTLFHPGAADLPPSRANTYTRKKSMDGNSDNFGTFLNVC